MNQTNQYINNNFNYNNLDYGLSSLMFYSLPFLTNLENNIANDHMLINFMNNQLKSHNLALKAMGGQQMFNINDKQINEKHKESNSNSNLSTSLEDEQINNTNNTIILKDNKNDKNYKISDLFIKALKEIKSYYKSIDSILNTPSLASFYFCNMEEENDDFEFWNNKISRWGENVKMVKKPKRKEETIEEDN